LSEKEFYRELNLLKKKQKKLSDYKSVKGKSKNDENLRKSTPILSVQKEEFSPKLSSACSHKLSNIQDDYEMFTSLKCFRSKSISPMRNENRCCKNFDEEKNFYSDVSHDKTKSFDHTIKRDPIKEIPITSKIPLFKQVMEDQEHR
jgi:hypothetical protein